MTNSNIHTLLIANRGEIACRIMRSCKRLGIQTVAVFSDADRHAPHVKMADKAVFIGESEVASSYLNQDKIIGAAKRSGANAIHPGYGFLSENAGFAARVISEGLIWVGPNPNAIDRMGSKSNAKTIAMEHEVPVIPGYKGEDQSEERLKSEALKIGFPVLLKAAAGGGGKGMRIVHAENELGEAIQGAQREGLSSFGNAELLIEKYFPSSRHIEIQIFGDKHGNAIHLAERECTVQRRYQKVLEESPSPVLSEETRQQMGAAAVRLAKALAYDNAGTVEFIYSGNEFFFLEVNTRLQVEHPVTEAITGLDLVELQIRSAEGKALPLKQEDVKTEGYALECRLYAEDPANQFLPGSGKILEWKPFQTEGLRYDSGVESGSEISIYYDPMISKIIAHGPDRETVINRMEYALRKTVCAGLSTNQSFLLQVLANADFRKGNYDTHFIDSHFTAETLSGINEEALIKAALAMTAAFSLEEQAQRSLLKNIPLGWRNNFYQKQSIKYKHKDRELKVSYRFQHGAFEMECDGATYALVPSSLSGNEYSMEINGIIEKFNLYTQGNSCYIHQLSQCQTILQRVNRFPEANASEEKGGYVSPMPASVVKILVSKGDKVKNGQSLLIISSMKMENTIAAAEDGTIEDLFVKEGENIEAGRILLQLNPANNA